MSRDTHVPEVISLLTQFQGKSVGFTMKPFESPPNKLVAARFWIDQADMDALLR